MAVAGELRKPLDIRIWALMKAQGLDSLCALATKIGRKDYPATVYRVLCGSNKHASFKMYVAIAAKLGVPINKLALVFLDYGKERAIKEFRALMHNAGYPSVYALSKALGWDPNMIGQMSRGNHQHIQLRVYRDISRGLGCSLDELSDILLTVKVLPDMESSVKLERMMNDESPSSATNPKFKLYNQVCSLKFAATA